MNSWLAGYPRSGTHRLRQIVWCLIHQRPFDYPHGFQWLANNGYPFTHGLGSSIEGKAIYQIRNEADVIKSWNRYFPFCKDGHKPVVEGILEGAPPDFAERYKRWSNRENNIQSYINRPDTLIINYEDFGEPQVQEIANFLNLRYNPDIIRWMEFEYRRYNDLLPLPNGIDKTMMRFEQWTEKL